MDVNDQKGPGRALQLTPSWGVGGNSLWNCFMAGAENCLAQSTCLPWMETSV